MKQELRDRGSDNLATMMSLWHYDRQKQLETSKTQCATTLCGLGDLGSLSLMSKRRTEVVLCVILAASPGVICHITDSDAHQVKRNSPMI